MSITGKQLINGKWIEGQAGHFQAVAPATQEQLAPLFSKASHDQVRAAVAAAAAAASDFRRSSLTERAAFLRACAAEIIALGDHLVQRAMVETGLPQARIEAERGRTCGQLELFADTVLAGDFIDARIDPAMPERAGLPRPDVRSMNQAIGPVVVFGASNFPLAFSVAGGDTASAFAAGCPVLVKGHSSHPGTCELVAQAINRAAISTGMAAGVFSLLMGSGRVVGAALVTAPDVKAVGFTGSFAGGMALVKLAADRPEPIPVFTEMGSLNPVVLLPQALQDGAEQIAVAFVDSLNLGVGQFCTNPGLVLAVAGPDLERFLATAANCLARQPAGVMLNDGIRKAYMDAVAHIAGQAGVACRALGAAAEDRPGFCGQPTLLTVTAADFVTNSALREEMFGPAALVVRCRDMDELQATVASLKGQLAGTIHSAPGEMADYPELTDLLLQRVGRLLVNGFPTGVEVCHAMIHGGPFPATSDARFTSVGTAAIKRFLRPVCLQNYPAELLPAALQDSNPLQIWRLINGQRTRSPI